MVFITKSQAIYNCWEDLHFIL